MFCSGWKRRCRGLPRCRIGGGTDVSARGSNQLRREPCIHGKWKRGGADRRSEAVSGLGVSTRAVKLPSRRPSSKAESSSGVLRSRPATRRRYRADRSEPAAVLLRALDRFQQLLRVKNACHFQVTLSSCQRVVERDQQFVVPHSVQHSTLPLRRGVLPPRRRPVAESATARIFAAVAVIVGRCCGHVVRFLVSGWPARVECRAGRGARAGRSTAGSRWHPRGLSVEGVLR